MSLWKDGRFQTDPWRHIEEGEDVPPSGRIILPLDWWQSQRAIFDQSQAAVGVRLAPGEDVQALRHDQSRIALIALQFPSFADGRAFSMAAALRDRLGYRGILRARGDILIDQMEMMLRCGFDEFEISNSATEKALRSGGIPQQIRYYQPGQGPEDVASGPPWRRERLVDPAKTRTDEKNSFVELLTAHY